LLVLLLPLVLLPLVPLQLMVLTSTCSAYCSVSPRLLSSPCAVACTAGAAADVFDQHLLSTLQVRTLQGVTDAALDEAGEGLLDWRLLEPSCRLRGLPKLMQMVNVSNSTVCCCLVGVCSLLALVVQ
jgi:hypothetical protein